MPFNEAKIDKVIQLLRAMLRLEPKKRERIGTLLGSELFESVRMGMGEGKVRGRIATDSDDKVVSNGKPNTNLPIDSRRK